MKLSEVQKVLKAPKNQFNAFGKYKYRNAEDILEAVKEVLNGEATITITDELVLIGERYYIKSTATFKSDEEEVSCVAYAREEESQKGMSSSQITGSTSSYSKKYALNNLFAIDDTKDSDSTNKHGKEETADPNLVTDFSKILNNFETEKGLIDKAKDLRDTWVAKGINEKVAGDMINGRVLALRKK